MIRMTQKYIAHILAVTLISAAEIPFKPTPDRVYDIHHTRIELTVDLEEEFVQGRVTHSLSPYSENLSSLSFDCADTQVHRVVLNGKTPIDFDLYDKKLWINLDRSFGFQDTISLTIDYRSTPTRGLYFIHSDSIYPEKHNQAWTQGEQNENHHWVPLHDYPNDKATFETILTVKKPYVAVSNGELVSTKDNGKTRTYHWRENSPMVSYLISFAIGDYKKIEDSLDGLPVNYWVYPEHSREDALRSFGKTPEMIDVFGKILDFPYPYEKYDQVILEDFMFGGMENITLTHQTDRTMHPETARPDHTSDGLVAHELAHQWFGNLLTTRNWANIWLNEGITSFTELIWVEAEKGRDEMEYYRYNDLKGMLRAAKYDPRSMVYFNYTDMGSLFNGNVYAKGAIIMNLLRDYLGYEAFYRGLRKYVRDNAYKNVETNDLKKAFEESTGKNLYWFFDQWAYRMGVPELEVSYKYDRRNKRVKMKIKQTQNVEETSLFKLPMTVLIDDGEIKRHRIFFDKQEDEFTFPCTQPPRMVILDEGQKTPKILTLKKSQDELVFQLENAPHVLDRVWAAVELGQGRPRKKSEDALLKSMISDPFWGVRKEAAIAYGKLNPKGGAEKILDLPEEIDSRVLRERIKALGKYKKNDFVNNYLVKILKTDERDYVLRDAFNTLVKVDPNTAEGWIDWALEKDSHGDGLRRSAISALAEDKSDENFERIQSLAQYGGTTWNARPTAVYHLAGFVEDRPKVLEWFVDQLNDPNRAVRRICIRTVGDQGSKKHISALSALNDPYNQKSIDRAIKNLEKPKRFNRARARKKGS